MSSIRFANNSKSWRYNAFRRRIIAIEPNPNDFRVLKLNCPNQVLINKALGNKNDNLNFYISTSTGDSSIIKPKFYDEKISVEVIKLDDLIKNLKIEKIKLLKLEAEGRATYQ